MPSAVAVDVTVGVDAGTMERERPVSPASHFAVTNENVGPVNWQVNGHAK